MVFVHERGMVFVCERGVILWVCAISAWLGCIPTQHLMHLGWWWRPLVWVLVSVILKHLKEAVVVGAVCATCPSIAYDIEGGRAPVIATDMTFIFIDTLKSVKLQATVTST
jgi:hypothetical protein